MAPEQNDVTLIRRKVIGTRFAARLLGVTFFCALGASQPLRAAEIQTGIIDIHQGSALTETVRDLEAGGYELAHGQWQSFYAWYHTDWVDVRVDMLTQYSSDFGILWGVSTGESGEKFTIEPSVKLGIIAQGHPVPNSTLSLSIATILGGRLIERPCVADYGDIGGVQQVNCRFAASPIAPKDTLPLLLNVNPERLRVVLNYRATF
jgi:hypothetical protein